MKVMYLSHRDCVGFFQAAITVPIKTENGIPYIVAYASSNNSNCIWNLTETISKTFENHSKNIIKIFLKKNLFRRFGI